MMLNYQKAQHLEILYNFHTAGAYTTEYGTNFNGIDSPKIVFVNGILSDEEYEVKIPEIVEVESENSED